MQKILHVLGQLNHGGTELRTLDLLRRADRTRFQFDFCCLSGLPGALDAEVTALGSRIHYLRLGPGFPAAFRRLLRSERYTGVHSHAYYFSGLILRLAYSAGVPLRIAHFRCDRHPNPSFLRRLARPWLRRWINLYATHILGVCKGALAGSWDPAWEQDPRCQAVLNGFDAGDLMDSAAIEPNLLPPLPPGFRRVVNVGRIDEWKNQARVLTVFREMLKRDPALQLVFAGRATEPYYSQLLSSTDDISGRVRFLGVIGNVPALLLQSHLMLFPSRWEGLPGAVLEACATGTPVIASDLPGVLEIAQYCSHLEPLSLQSSDSVWAETALRRMRAGNAEPFSKQDAMRQWMETPFTLHQSLAQMESIYESGGDRA